MGEQMRESPTMAELALAGDGPYWFTAENARWLAEFCRIHKLPKDAMMELLEEVEDMCKDAESEGVSIGLSDW